MNIDFQKLKTQGSKINYYYICKRKLWFYDKGISMEDNSDRVLQGKILHESSYPRIETREILIDDMLKIDMMDNDFIQEIKISSKMTKADYMQTVYYLYYLKQLGIEKKGMVNYVKERKREEIHLTEELEKDIEQALIHIKNILSQDKPPKLEKLPYCKKCAYYGFCFVKEDDEN